MKIIRQIDVFDKSTEVLVDEIVLDSFNLEKFKMSFKIKSNDLDMFDPYEITELTKDLFLNINFDFNKFYYYLACYQE